MDKRFTVIEICAGAGGQALGLEQAGFEHVALVEYDRHACQTLRLNRPMWNVIEQDVRRFSGYQWDGVDLFAAGVPCPPFSIAGKQRGASDERDLFPEALRLIAECRPKAVLLENVRGLLDPNFDNYRNALTQQLEGMGYHTFWRLLNASDYGVAQLRPRVLCVGLRAPLLPYFVWPKPVQDVHTVGAVLYDEMARLGWRGAQAWRETANQIAPTLVGGSKKHGGPDLGPTRARKAWIALGVDGGTLAEQPPAADFEGMPRLTVKMAALLQGFPFDWQFVGKKTPAYRQVGNAFPPPVARAVGTSLVSALERCFSSEESVIEQ